MLAEESTQGLEEWEEGVRVDGGESVCEWGEKAGY